MVCLRIKQEFTNQKLSNIFLVIMQIMQSFVNHRFYVCLLQGEPRNNIYIVNVNYFRVLNHDLHFYAYITEIQM